MRKKRIQSCLSTKRWVQLSLSTRQKRILIKKVFHQTIDFFDNAIYKIMHKRWKTFFNDKSNFYNEVSENYFVRIGDDSYRIRKNIYRVFVFVIKIRGDIFKPLILIEEKMHKSFEVFDTYLNAIGRGINYYANRQSGKFENEEFFNYLEKLECEKLNNLRKNKLNRLLQIE